MSNTILLKRGSSTQWQAANIVLASGEPGFDLTNNILKIGDGLSPWNDLPIANSNIPNFIANTGSFGSLSAATDISVNTIRSNGSQNIILKPSGLGNPVTAYRKVSIEGDALEVGRSGNYNFNIASNSNNSGDINIFNTNGNINLMSDSGNIGIGTQEPLSTLHVYSPISGASLFTVEGSNGVLFSISDNNSDVVLNANNEIGEPVFQVFKDGRLVAGRPDQNDFVITSNGYIGLGTSSPSHKLDVKGIVDASGLNSIYLTSSYINAFNISAQNINLLPSGQLVCNSGNFNILNVDNVPVSVSGHSHISSDITDFNSSVSGLLPVKDIIGGSNISVSNTSGNYTVSVSGSLGLTTEEVDDRVASLLVAGTGINLNYNDAGNSLTINVSGFQPTGNYSLVGHTHTSSNITDFNTSVSGLLPVKNITAGTNITISSNSGTYTINSSTVDIIHPFLLGGM